MEVCLDEDNGCDADLDACLDSVKATVEDASGKVWEVQEESPEEVSPSHHIMIRCTASAGRLRTHSLYSNW